MNKSVCRNFSLQMNGRPIRIQSFWTRRRVRQQEYNRFGTSGGFASKNTIVLDTAEGLPGRIQSFWTK